MLICLNINSPEYKSWENAGISKKDIYTEYVLNNYTLPMYSRDVNKALTFPEINSLIEEYSSLSEFGIKDISSLKHSGVNAIGAFFKDVLYFSKDANLKTISEEVGHALLQRFADSKTYNTLIEAGGKLLEARLAKEGRTKEQYLQSLQSSLNISKDLAERYANEEEIIKDYVLFDTTGTFADKTRKINELTNKLSFLGNTANKVAKLWYNFIEALNKLFSKPNQVEEALALLQSLKRGAQVKYDRGYTTPSYMFIPRGRKNVGVSPFSYQRVVNDVAATYFNRHSDKSNFKQRVETIFNDFADYYEPKLNATPNDSELSNLYHAATALEIDYDLTDDYGNAKKSTRDETIDNVIAALNVLGIKIEESDLSEDVMANLEDEAGGHHRWDQSANQMGVESLSLGLKNIILRVGRKEQFGTDENGKPRILTFAPDVSHIYSGLVRYSSKVLTTDERWKRMVEFSTIVGNNSSKLLIQDYYLQDFVTKATYKGQPLRGEGENADKDITKWLEAIASPDFTLNDVVINDPILGQEFITLLKGLELVSRDMKTTQLLLEKEYTGFSMFDTNSNGITNRLLKTYGDAINAQVQVFKDNRDEFNKFEIDLKGKGVINKLLELLSRSNIYISGKVLEEIKNNEDFGNRTGLGDIHTHISNAVLKDKPLIETGENYGSLNSLIEQVIGLQIEYDESILENSFTNLEGKTIYGFQRQTPIILTLRNLANKEFLDKFKDGSPYIDQNNEFTANGFKNNPIVEAFKKLSAKERKELSKTFSLDGVFSKNDSGFREDVSFSDMTDRHFAAVSMNMMIKATNEMDKKTDNGFWTAVTLGHNEASSLIDYNYVPVLRGDDFNTALSTLIEQEQARIKLIESRVNEFIVNTKHPIVDGVAEITYEQLKNYFKPLGVPVYKGMLEGKYVMKEPITNEDGSITYPGIDLLQNKEKTKQLRISKNLNDLVSYEEIIEGRATVEQVIANLEKVLDAQVETLQEMKVIELLDRTIVDPSNLGKEETKKNSPAIKAFGLTTDIYESSVQYNVKQLLKQFWLGSTFSNQILVGDPMISFKNDFKDILKRHRSHNAALLGVDVPFSVPSLGIYPKSEVTMVITTSDETAVYDSPIDKDDAQSYSSLDFWLYKQFTKGKLTQNSRNAWLRIQAGESLSYSEIADSNAFMASDKTITAQGNQIVKHSEHYILPTAVAFVNKSSLAEAQEQGYFIAQDGKLKIKPGEVTKDVFVGYQIGDKTVVNKLEFFEHRQKQAEKYLVLEGYSLTLEGYQFNGGVDIKTVTTASKGAQKNVIDRNKLLEEYSSNPSYYTQRLAANTYGDQVENPQGKDHVIDASQNQEIKTNEIENAKELVEKYFTNQADRNNFEIDLVLKELYGPNYKNSDAKLEAKQFLEAITRVMKDSGTDNQKLDFLTFRQIGDEFVANYNLNLPPVRQKFTQSLFKLFTRALKHKVAGNSLVQVSSSDYNLIKRAKVVKDVTVTLPNGTKAVQDIITWDVVSPEEFRADTNKSSLGDLSKLNYNGKNQIEKKEDQLTKAILEAGEGNVYFFDEVRFMKPYINASNELEYFVSEAIMPPWFDENIPEALRQQYGVRIPSQDKQSSVAIEWVSNFEAALGNSIVVPKEIIYLSGSDFDIDKLFTQRVEGFFKKGEFFPYENNFEHFKEYMFSTKKFFKSSLIDLLNGNDKYKEIVKEYKDKLAEKQSIIDYLKELKKEYKETSEANFNAQIKILNDNINQGGENKKIAKEAVSYLKEIDTLQKQSNNIKRELGKSLSPESNIEKENDLLNIYEKIEEVNGNLQELYDDLGFDDIFENNRQTFKRNKEVIKEYSESIKEINTSVKQLKETKDKVENVAKLSLLEKYNYPTDQSNYNITYPAVINNDQLRISSKLLSEPEVIYGEQGSIYETPATVKPYRNIFENYQIEVEKGTRRERELNKKGYYKEEKENTTVFYPFKTEKGESMFEKDPENIQTFSLLNFSIYQQAVQAAKAGIGLLANANVLGIFAKKMGINLKTPIVFEGKEFKEFRFKTEKNRRVFDAISSTISVTTDEAKESQLSNHGISTNDLKVMSVLMLHGFDIEDAFALTRSKGAKEYNKRLDRNKIDREKVTESNETIIKKYLGDFEITNFEMSRVEFEGISTLPDDILEKKYFLIYNNILGMYSELSSLIPAVKLKTGVANSVSDFQRSLSGLTKSSNSEEEFKFYNLPNPTADFNNALNIYSQIEKVATKELIEMKPTFSILMNAIDSSVTKEKRKYGENIRTYIDQFLVGEYARNLASTQGLFTNYETFTKSLLEKRDRLFALVNNEPANKAAKESLAYLNKIIQVKAGDKIVLNFEGKLNQSLKDMVSDSWLLLKHSPIQEAKEIADDLFKYYFLKDAMQYKPGSLEILFPASKFKGISEVYDEILEKESVPSEETTLRFVTYIALTNPEYFKNHKDFNSAFATTDKTIWNKIAFDKNTGVITMLNPGDYPKIQVINGKMRILVDNKYIPVETIIPSEFNNYLVKNEAIDNIYKTLENERGLDEVIKQEPKKSIDLKDYTNYSGAAIGGDTIWENIGKEFGLGKQVNYRPEDLSKLTVEQKQEVENAYQKAVKDLGRKSLDSNSFAGGLVRRDYLQAKAADAIFAISTIIEPGQKDSKGYVNKTSKSLVSGGTGYAVQMGINLGKEVFVFDQEKNKWFTWNGLAFVETPTPRLTKKFAGIGTREINENGKIAIRKVYENSVFPEIIQQKSEVKETSVSDRDIVALMIVAEDLGKFIDKLIKTNNISYSDFSNEMSRLLLKPELLFDAVSVVKRAKEYADSKKEKDKNQETNTREYTPENITSLKPNEVFVFGANTAGGHGGGTAGLAQRGTTSSNYTALPIGTKGKWSEYGIVDKLMQGTEGKSFGIVTKDASIVGNSLKIGSKRSVPLSRIEESITALIKTAIENPELKFLVTKFGTNMAGFSIEEMKSLLVNKELPNNIVLPKEFEVRGETTQGNSEFSMENFEDNMGQDSLSKSRKNDLQEVISQLYSDISQPILNKLLNGSIFKPKTEQIQILKNINQNSFKVNQKTIINDLIKYLEEYVNLQNTTEIFLTTPSIEQPKVENNIISKYELFPGVEANTQQKEAIDKFNNFLDGKLTVNGQNTFASLLGKGGTGKSTIVKKIIGNRKALYIAPTHKAKEVLAQATGERAITLASALGVSMDETTGKFVRLEFEGSKLPIANSKLVVIDESSMIQDEYLQLIKDTISPNTKVIFMGDNHQLPPVGQDSDAKVFEYKLAELTERMRQGENSPIVPITDMVADNIEKENIDRVAITNRTNNFNSETNQGVIFEKDLKNAFKLWEKDFIANPRGTKIITFNNENNNNAQSVKSLNRLARNILFNNPTEEFLEGEQVTGYEQYGDPENPDLLNSVDYTVMDVYKQNKSDFNISAYSRAKGTRNVTVNVSGYNLSLQNNLTGENSTVFALDPQSKEIVKSKVNELYNGTNKDTQLATVLNKYFAKLEHGYTVTSHKSQGSTYKNVYVMEDNILGNSFGSNKSINQSLYVAVSRPSDKLVIVSSKNPTSYSEESSNFDENNNGETQEDSCVSPF